MILFADKVARIRQTPDGEERNEFEAHVISEEKITLRPNSDVDTDDLIEWVTPLGRKKLLRVTKVVFHNSPHRGIGNKGHLDHTEVYLTRADAPRPVQPIRQVKIEGMHPAISETAGRLFADGHRAKAVFEAFRAVESRVQALSSVDQSGKKLMSMVFGGLPKLDVTTRTGQNAQDEREGFNQLFMGAVQGIRNPRGHGESIDDTPEEAIEYLSVASMLMRRLDLAEKRLADQVESA
ncbi:TIGR02391 family protein [Pseudonocardia xinjiangensis]|uniref:TIGR02391 family protein n=1 Tax=Pseudonocardia xinjiangensis TaxID=75289 RepID=UPI003D91B874